MTGDVLLPFGADPITITVTFIVASMIFYVLLVRACGRNKIAWKRVDYVWLALSGLGVYGTVQTVRTDFARDRLELYEGDADLQWRYLLIEANDDSSPAGSVCHMRPGVEKSLSDARRADVVNQFKEECALLGTYAAMLHRLQRPSDEFYSKFPEPPLPWKPDAEINREIERLNDTYRRVAADSMKVRNLMTVKKRSTNEQYFFEISPFVLTIAMALRFVKTIGEIRLEVRPESR